MSNQIRTVEVKKSVLAQLRGLGYQTSEIATRLGITVKETKTALEHFGLVKTRTTVPLEYNVSYINDVQEVKNEVNN